MPFQVVLVPDSDCAKNMEESNLTYAEGFLCSKRSEEQIGSCWVSIGACMIHCIQCKFSRVTVGELLCQILVLVLMFLPG